MKIFSKILKNKFRLFMTAVVFLSISFNPVIAATSSEIGQQIDQKKTELDALKKQLSSLEKEKTTLTKQKSGIQGEIETVQNEIKLVTNNITTNEIKIQELDKEKEIKELEIDNRRLGLNSKMSEFYMLQYDSDNSAIVPGNDMEISWVGQKYSKLIIEKERAKITILGEEVMGITKAIEEQNFLKSEYSAKNVELDKEKKELEAKLATLQGSINKQNSISSNIKKSINTVTSAISLLTSEQKRLEEEEEARMKGLGTIVKYNVNSGEYYFGGNERDIKNGHYVGLMQWGAYDLANDGMSYIDILKKFYTGTSVGGDYSGYNISVIGYGTMNIETYVSGLGEVPDKVCGTSEQVMSNPNKYIINNPKLDFDCWPEEAIKAQVVAARSYALYLIINEPNYGSVRTDANFQVYKGGTAKKWVSDETKGQVGLYGGGVINAMYSSTACGVTMNNDDRFLGWDRKTASWTLGYAKPYLRAVSYNARSGNSYCNWNWNTKGYSKDRLTEIFNSMGYGIGQFQSMNYERMLGSRVRWLNIVGSNGTKKVPGLVFKSDWNKYVETRENKMCTATNHGCDYVYGVKFTLFQKP